MGQALSELFPPKPKWTVDQIPDLSGKVAIVTVGNTGIGKATCKHLLLHNAKVYMASRSPERAEAAIADLKTITKKDDIHFIKLDLADLENVKASAAEFQSKEKELHMLYNNAGVMSCPMDMLTTQGFDLQFGTNAIGHAYFTKLLIPTLLETAKTTPGGMVRVINTSSGGHVGAPKSGILWETLKDGPERNKKLSRTSAYFQSKWANVIFSNELARRYGDQGVVSTSLNPGAIDTELARYIPKWAAPLMILFKLLLSPADPNGAMTQLYAGTAPETASANGKYFIPWAREGLPRKDTDNEGAEKKLWDYIDEVTAGI
ncbi:NADP-binding protein [Dacryopinax primogenitus]|uniref:NADP-binding protein n=1 Tax=Dacryopinax primogenitus (strain DJM 731) TaxID=1858805 RepID=M5G2P4_DACPD|nr:NADP-binding protein [Dacryopinax primogenitus]EJU00117.1 NADP-binding protein [Dacryopinax primogenitus]